MGRITACTPLFRWIGPPPPLELKVQSTWEGVYSAGQELAAAEIVSSVQSKTELLVWAVCGAGKTEILFPAIEQSLQKGEHVLIATPRTDVVLELAPRLSRSFPGIPVTALHGKSDDKNSYSPFVVATTHQTMRFTEAFDTVIVDEVDAFPYTADEALVQAVNKAKKQDAAVIYLTATPTPELIKRTQHKRLDLAKIPRRFHGHPLPVPRFKWCGPWRKRLKKEQLPAAVSKWCRTKIAEQTPVFLFVSSVAIMEKTTSILQKLDPAICGVHSADKERHEKVKAFREGEIPILITTTILERGVTIPGAEAAVFGAEDSIFTESALVQIAGRVGRSHEQPDGEVLFFHFGKTKAMAAAHKHIKTMNALPFLQKEVTPIGKEEST
nr:DEAD/DEAH box helicase [Bacillus piscicola]